jgi:hypothetical protein
MFNVNITFITYNLLKLIDGSRQNAKLIKLSKCAHFKQKFTENLFKNFIIYFYYKHISIAFKKSNIPFFNLFKSSAFKYI